jgi:L-methionine (R)-S-oxide reductase
MSFELKTPITGDKLQIYRSLAPQIAALVEGESNTIANLANFCAVLKSSFGWLWIGFYLVEGEELVLGPFQGPVACTRIKKGKGVCGSSWESKQIVIVPDVDAFRGHIACSTQSRSEIVIPLLDDTNNVWAVLDVDSALLNDFDATDSAGLSECLRPLMANR